ncbi:hypothetical protein Goarm_023348, partial [Gossypium armourianum]|nr:hypothetical protein [Gossypium armourianum]
MPGLPYRFYKKKLLRVVAGTLGEENCPKVVKELVIARSLKNNLRTLPPSIEMIAVGQSVYRPWMQVFDRKCHSAKPAAEKSIGKKEGNLVVGHYNYDKSITHRIVGNEGLGVLQLFGYGGISLLWVNRRERDANQLLTRSLEYDIRGNRGFKSSCLGT